MDIFSYVVARDFGFAPNPFGGFCTLATCKPNIRKHAQIDDWIVGTGSTEHNRNGVLVYVMKIAETMSFDEYWMDARFQCKKPVFTRGNRTAFGDNIYHNSRDGWLQLNSHHSYANGSSNFSNLQHDTQTNRVLIATEFAYWGGEGPQIPRDFRDYYGEDICKSGPGHKRYFSETMQTAFLSWFSSLEAQGCLGRPIDW